MSSVPALAAVVRSRAMRQFSKAISYAVRFSVTPSDRTACTTRPCASIHSAGPSFAPLASSRHARTVSVSAATQSPLVSSKRALSTSVKSDSAMIVNLAAAAEFIVAGSKTGIE